MCSSLYSLNLLTVIYFSHTIVSHVNSKTISGILTTAAAKLERGQYLTAFGYHGETAELRYTLNTTSDGAKLFLFLNDDWGEATDAETCTKKLQKARLIYHLNSTQDNISISQYSRPRIWHVVYADSFTCDPARPQVPLERPHYILYHISLLNPDSLSNPTSHFSCEETGLLLFYQLLILAYFVLACICAPKLWQTLSKGGPMQLVIQLLTASMGLQAVGAFVMMVHLQRYSRDGIGSPFGELLSELFDVLSQFAMLYMLLCLSLGWTLGSTHRSSYLDAIRNKPAFKVVGLLSMIQGSLFMWEQYQDREHRMYHAHRSYAGAALVLLRIFLAALFSWNLNKTLTAQRSALKRQFYLSFTKSCMLWFLSFPLFVLISLVFAEYLRYKFITMGVVLCQSVAVTMLYKLFLSRSLYWEVSALSSTLPLRIDKTLSIKLYS